MIPLSPHPNESFAERLRLWRVSQNFTQAEAAKLLDIDRSYLSQVERGRSPGNALRTRFFLIEKSSSVKVNGNVAAAYGLRNLPVLSWTQAGHGREFGRNPPGWGGNVAHRRFHESPLRGPVQRRATESQGVHSG